MVRARLPFEAMSPSTRARLSPWRLRASWHGTTLHEDEIFELDGVVEKSVELIPEVIEGQTEEQWKRAGRKFPFPGR